MKPSLLKLHLRLVVDGKIDGFVKKVLECKELYKTYTKDQLYCKLLEVYESKTRQDRTHIISIKLDSKRKLGKERWNKARYYNVLAIFELDLYDGIFEYAEW